MSIVAGLRRSIFTSSVVRSARPTNSFRASLYTPLFSNNTAARAFSATTNIMGVHNLSQKSEFDSAVAEKDSLMVLDCFATWCGPCKVIAPQVVKFSEEFPNARFFKIDVDEVPDVAQELGIRAMPTFILFKGGEKVGEVVGANPVALKAAIAQHA